MSARFIGALLILVGLFALFLPNFRYTTEETVLDVGPLEVTAEREKRIPLRPIAGGASIIGGLALAFRRRQ
ncbi:MAG: DUF3185 domain-containing protein [Vicinamibacterales bacterium]